MDGLDRRHDAAVVGDRRFDDVRDVAADVRFAEWDRSEWVGEGQEPHDAVAFPARLQPEVRWTKWEWIGEGQGAAGPRRGLPAEAMPDGENQLSGHRHNPAMAHWGGRRPRLARRPRPFEVG